MHTGSHGNDSARQTEVLLSIHLEQLHKDNRLQMYLVLEARSLTPPSDGEEHHKVRTPTVVKTPPLENKVSMQTTSTITRVHFTVVRNSFGIRASSISAARLAAGLSCIRPA